MTIVDIQSQSIRSWGGIGLGIGNLTVGTVVLSRSILETHALNVVSLD